VNLVKHVLSLHADRLRRLVKKEGAVADKTLLDTRHTLQEVFAE